MEGNSIEKELNKNYSFIKERFEEIRQIIETNERLMITNNEQFLSDLEARGMINAKERRVFSNNPDDMWHIMRQEQFNLSTMPNIFRQGFVIIAYSVFEIGLGNLATITEQFTLSKLKIKDLVSNGSDIEKILNYFRKVIEVDFEDVNNLWIKLDEYRLIRNLIVHHHGNIELYKTKNISNIKAIDKFIQIIENDPDLNSLQGKIKISRNFILKNIEIMEKFTKIISDKLSNKLH